MKKTVARQSMRSAALIGAFLFFVWAQPWKLVAQAPEFAKGVKYAQINQADMKEWLTYLSSDELEGRQVFTEGYGLAAQYVADHLKEWGVKPLGPNGSYLQPVRLRGYKATRNSSVTLEVNGQSQTFKHGSHVTFNANAGGKQTLTFDGIEFLGYGLPDDYQGRDIKDKLVLTVPNLAPAPRGERGNAGGLPGAQTGARGGNAVTRGAKAAITFAPAPPAPTSAEQALAQAQTALTQANTAVAQAQQAVRAARGNLPAANGQRGGAGRGAPAPPDFTSVQRVDLPVAPQFSGDETFFAAMFEASSLKFAEIKAKAEKGEPIAPLSLPAKVTISIDNSYDLISEQIAHNVVGMVEGTDPILKDTYVLFGAHLDDIGYDRPAMGEACSGRVPTTQSGRASCGRSGRQNGPKTESRPRRGPRRPWCGSSKSS